MVVQMNKCPCCGSSVDIPVIVDLNRNMVSVNGSSVKVSPQCAEILHILSESYPATVPYDRIYARLHGVGGGPENARNALSVQHFFLRRALAGLNLKVASVWGVGLRLEYSPKAQSAA